MVSVCPDFILTLVNKLLFSRLLLVIIKQVYISLTLIDTHFKGGNQTMGFTSFLVTIIGLGSDEFFDVV